MFRINRSKKQNYQETKKEIIMTFYKKNDEWFSARHHNILRDSLTKDCTWVQKETEKLHRRVMSSTPT